jgi:serine/threonine protein kinase
MLGQKLNNRYIITGLLGEGAMGEVYLATDEQTGQQVAVKVLARQLITHPDLIERFRREADTLRQLDHPNIVKFVDTFEHGGQYVIVMEYVPGGSLHQLIKKGPLPIDHAHRIALELCDALIRSHHLKIIHRDIKPDNVLITEDGTPKLADFGVARLTAGTRMTQTGTKVGTPYYMAPEAWKGETIDGQADIWSLGVMLFEMLSGNVPFDGDSEFTIMTKVTTTSPPDLKKLRSDVPPGLVKIIERMLRREKAQRYQTMRELAADLERGGQQSKTISPQTTAGIVIVALITLAGMLFLSGALNPSIPEQTPSSASTSTESTKEETTPTLQVIAMSETVEPSQVPTELTDSAGVTMVLVPAGEFTMGSSDGESDEEPTHQVVLNAFYIDKYEVTNTLYKACVDAGACDLPRDLASATRTSHFGNPEFGAHPVINVDWPQAKSYCEWRTARLPTEAEWEKAARGEDARKYPWGNSINPSLANYFNTIGDTREVGSYEESRSSYEVYNLAGNVWEWVSDVYDPNYYSALSSFDNPTGPTSGNKKVIRGGSWNDDANALRSANRAGLDLSAYGHDVGFRCAMDASIPIAEPANTDENAWSEIISVRLPTLNETRDLLSIWDANALIVEDMLSPGVQTFSGDVDANSEYLWTVYWCAVDRATLERNLEKFSTFFMVDGEKVPDEYIFEYYVDANDGWKCNYRAIVIGNFPTNLSLNLQATRILATEISDGQSTYPAGSYTYELVVLAR